MKASVRRLLIAGNWKMNKTSSEAAELVEEISLAVGKQLDVAVAVCPPFTSMESVAHAIEDSNIQLGAQNMHSAPAGAYTGEISAEMLRHLFASFVILGHSERRTYFSESNASINRKVRAALESSLKPILCVGESLAERERGGTIGVVGGQVRACLHEISGEGSENIVIAYEPIWAIGTGKTATPAMAQEVHGEIRRMLTEILGASIADRIRILYGGSMKLDNAGELLDQPDIDGGLIGGASLEARSFIRIVELALERAQ